MVGGIVFGGVDVVVVFVGDFRIGFLIGILFIK